MGEAYLNKKCQMGGSLIMFLGQRPETQMIQMRP